MMAVHLARSRVGLLAQRLSGLHDSILVLHGGAVRLSVAGLRATYGEKYPYPVPFDYVNKKYRWYTALYERTIHRFNENSKIIVVDGNIGVGKTDFAKRLAKQFDLKFFPATPERDCYMYQDQYDLRKLDPLLPPAARIYDLKKFYSDPHPEKGLIGKLLLSWYEAKFFDYLAALRHLVNTGQGVVMVGSAYSDAVFVEALRNMGWVSANFVKYYNDLRTQSICELYRPHLTIYLDAPISVIRQRINQANDPRVVGSRNLTDEFLEMIHRVYQQRHLPKMRESGEVVEIDWTEIATKGDMDAIAEELQNLKLEGEDNEDPKFSDWARQDEDDWTKFRANLEDPDWPLQFIVQPDPWDCPELMMDVDDRIAIGDMTRKHPLFNRDKGFATELGDNPYFSFKINKCCCQKRTFLKPLM